MSFCTKCGKELVNGAAFCTSCGAAVEAIAYQPEPVAEPVTEPVAEPVAEPAMEQAEAEQVVAEQVIPAAPVEASDNEAMYAEEKECLDDYYKLLKWERISWSITGKVFLIISCIFGGICALIFTMALASDVEELALFSMVYLLYPLMFLPIAIINLKMVKKVQYYMDTLYTDIRPAAKRCESVGMIVFCYFFNSISMIFYIINFARTKSNKGVIARIVAHQQEGK